MGVWIWTTTYSNNLQQQSSNSVQTAEAPTMYYKNSVHSMAKSQKTKYNYIRMSNNKTAILVVLRRIGK